MSNPSNITLYELKAVCENIANTCGQKALEGFLIIFWSEVSHAL